MQPGQTVTPGSESPQPEPTVEKNESTAAQPAVPNPVSPPPQQSPEPATSWQYTADSGSPEPYAAQPAAVSPIQPVSWTASEYISHAKGTSWFMLLGIGLFLLVGVVYLLTKDIFASIGVGVAGVAFAAFSVRPPRVLDYAINENGIQIGSRFYSYHEFKSFSVMHDGPLPSILLMPLKRFLPPITVFYEPQSEEQIIEVLSAYLPHESKQPDAVDKLMSRIRF
jgi:hypothetical protein